ncbi:MAG TPA: hypothetical protein VGB61_02635 [Pyrinomonadaceae bacterium]
MYSARDFIPALTLVASGAREFDHHQISPGGGHRFIIHTSFITDARRARRGRAPLHRLARGRGQTLLRDGAGGMRGEPAEEAPRLSGTREGSEQPRGN